MAVCHYLFVVCLVVLSVAQTVWLQVKLQRLFTVHAEFQLKLNTDCTLSKIGIQVHCYRQIHCYVMINKLLGSVFSVLLVFIYPTLWLYGPWRTFTPPLVFICQCEIHTISSSSLPHLWIDFCIDENYWLDTSLTERHGRVVNTPVLYLGNPWFKSWPGECFSQSLQANAGIVT
jgi:hypothetical protein